MTVVNTKLAILLLQLCGILDTWWQSIATYLQTRTTTAATFKDKPKWNNHSWYGGKYKRKRCLVVLNKRSLQVMTDTFYHTLHPSKMYLNIVQQMSHHLAATSLFLCKRGSLNLQERNGIHYVVLLCLFQYIYSLQSLGVIIKNNV